MSAELATHARWVGPDAVEILPHDSPEEEWLALRGSGIGASEVAALDSHSKYLSPYALWAAKTGRTEPEPRTKLQRIGLFMEDPIAGLFADNHPEYQVRQVGLVRNVTNGYEQATPDRELLDLHGAHAGLLEIKTGGFGVHDEWGEEGTDDVPVAYFIQVQWQCAVTGSPYVWVAVMFDGRDYREYLVARDDDVINYLRSRVAEFWHEHVLADVPPAVDGHEATTAALRHLPAKESAELDDTAASIAVAYWAEKNAEKQAATRAATYANLLRERLAGAELGTVDGRQIVSNKYQAGRTSFDVERFTADHPDLAAEYVKRGAAFPVLRVSKR